MIFDAGYQNKTLSEAGKTPKDTSPRLDQANRQSKDVSASKGDGDSSVNKGKRRINQSSGTVIQHGRPSYEGLMSSSSAHITMNNSGYLNKNMQTSRYSENAVQKQTMSRDMGSIPSISSLTSGIMSRANNSNYSGFTSLGSSSDRISKVIRNNNLV